MLILAAAMMVDKPASMPTVLGSSGVISTVQSGQLGWILLIRNIYQNGKCGAYQFAFLGFQLKGSLSVWKKTCLLDRHDLLDAARRTRKGQR